MVSVEMLKIKIAKGLVFILVVCIWSFMAVFIAMNWCIYRRFSKQCANVSVRHEVRAPLLTKAQQTKVRGGGKA